MLTPRSRYVLAAYAISILVLVGALALIVNDVGLLKKEMGDLKAVVAVLDSLARHEGSPVAVSPLLLDYQLDVPGRGEVFPAMLTPAATEYWPIAILRVTNTASVPSAQLISAEIPGWSHATAQSLIIGPLETHHVRIQPTLLSRAFLNNETQRAILEVRATGMDGAALYADSRPILIHGGSEIYWGQRFANAQMAARWVTPRDSLVLDLVSDARAYIARGRMAGYSSATGDEAAVRRHVQAQARAIYRALQHSGITYVSSLFVMGDYVDQAQRIRLPRETLRLKNANCMDVSVAFSSAIENLGMQPLLVIVPGHAFAGVRLGRDSEEILFLDSTVLPSGSFDAAIRRARSWVEKTPSEKMLVVDISAARALGIYPLAYTG